MNYGVIGVSSDRQEYGLLRSVATFGEASRVADQYRELGFIRVRVLAKGPRLDEAVEALILGVIQEHSFL